MRSLNFRTRDGKQEIFKSPALLRPLQDKSALKGASARRDKSRFGWYSKRGKKSFAYYAVSGCRNWYKKFGLKIMNADPHKWQERASVAGIVSNEEKRAVKCTLKNQKHTLSIPVNDPNSHGHDLHALNDPGPKSAKIHSGAEIQVSHSHHSRSRHSSGDGHFGWFFMSHWNMAGLNPYAICISNIKAGKMEVGNLKPKVSKSSAKSTDNPKIRQHSGSHVPSLVHSPCHKASYRQEHVKTQAISFFESFNRIGHSPVRKSEIQPKKAPVSTAAQVVVRANPLVKEEPAKQRTKKNAVQFSIITKGMGQKDQMQKSRQIPIIRFQHSESTTPIIYISSRVPQKIIPKKVVGAEALPE